MPFEIIRNDITLMQADAIVNTANPQPVIGSGTDAGIHAAAGPNLLKARKQIGCLSVGEAAITPGFGLNAKYVIHTVGPIWQGGGAGEEQLLERCYRASLELARTHRCSSIAFPLISAGIYGFPRDRALSCAIRAITAFLMEHEMQIWLVVFNREAFRLSEQLFQNIRSYIDEHYVHQKHRSEGLYRRDSRRSRLPQVRNDSVFEASVCEAAAAPKLSLEEYLKQTDKGFTEKLLELIDKSGKKDPEIYKKANISKQHFSKIRNNPAYNPTKPTAVALAMALELDLEQTRDLIGRAGYALTDSSKFDLIIRYFIERGNYNVIEVNLALYEFDQRLLGS